MGATTFETLARGKDAREAFTSACQAARHEYGHGGYTGTIAEKHSYVMVATGLERGPAIELARKLMDAGDRRINDKWGPAGCIKLTDGSFLFFGWASE